MFDLSVAFDPRSGGRSPRIATLSGSGTARPHFNAIAFARKSRLWSRDPAAGWRVSPSIRVRRTQPLCLSARNFRAAESPLRTISASRASAFYMSAVKMKIHVCVPSLPETGWNVVDKRHVSNGSGYRSRKSRMRSWRNGVDHLVHETLATRCR